MKIAIVGYDTEGRSSYDYFAELGHELTICDQNTALSVPDGAASVLGDSYLDDLDRFDLIVRTAGLPPHKILDKNPGVASKITTQVNEFFKVCPTIHIIGVTGTKGKGTTTTLISHILQTTRATVYVGGNIGTPPLTFLHKLDASSWVVLELSSFQLVDLQQSPHIAVCLMVVPEHLNWHADMPEYVAAKSQLFAHQKPHDIAVYYAENPTSKQIASSGGAQKTPFGAAPGATVTNGVITIQDHEICKTSELKLLGEHNWQNVCAAITATWSITQDVDAIRSAVTEFSGLPHRLELVRELNGVRYYDDSFGTTPETAIVALKAFDEPKVVILGGSDKGASYGELAQTVLTSNVRSVVLIGERAAALQASLKKTGLTNFVAGGKTMPEIVAACQTQAQPGDVVLLSTACASFDMFKDYKDRAAQFIAAVQALA